MKNASVSARFLRLVSFRRSHLPSVSVSDSGFAASKASRCKYFLHWLSFLAVLALSFSSSGSAGGASARVASLSPSCAVGTLPSESHVDALGQANYDIPITVPPGRAAMDPHISFHYNSMAPNGLFGVGWGLSGLSAITRCPSTYLQEGYVEPVHLKRDDALCLDGKHLVDIGKSATGNPQYRTNPDNQSLIVAYGMVPFSHDSDFLGFKVYTKDGLVMEYGGMKHQPKDASMQWTP